MPMNIRPLILCGGSGTRLWPLSRDTMPKQFIALNGERSLFQQTVLRVTEGTSYGRPVIVTAKAHRYEVERQLDAIAAEATILLEPEGRDSGPAILAGCLHLADESRDALALVLACDHHIGRPDAFHRSIREAEAIARDRYIVTFGMKPSAPATGYGYIEMGDTLSSYVAKVKRFVEKPDAGTAASYIAAGFLWNSGNFLVLPDVVVSEYERLDVDSFRAVSGAYDHATGAGRSRLLASTYGAAVRRSIDYAVMEKTSLAAVLPTDWDWSDVGTWDAVWAIGKGDADGNVIDGDVETLASSNCLVRSKGILTSLVGTKDLVVIVEQDAVMVADRRSSSSVKTLVENLTKRGAREASAHAREYRPWGWFEIRDAGETFKVKRLGVYPGGRLSLQKHHHRAEHWVVVTGTGKVTVDDQVMILTPNQHAAIPLGAVHRLENPGNTLLEIIEVQNGTYLGEDDIVRFEDVYDRVILDAAE